MSRKRRNTSSPEASPSPPPRQRAATPLQYESDDSVENDERPQLNQKFGQTGAFPGLGPSDSNEAFYGPANDGIDYLRMVRSEARGVPTLLTAPRTLDTTEVHTEREEATTIGGYWADSETYIGAPQQKTASTTQSLPAAQVRYYDSLLAQFRLLQATLRCTPPLPAIQALGKTHPISFPADSEQAAIKWREAVEEQEPQMVQMACLDQASLWELVGLLEVMLRDPEATSWERLGSWLWAALGRCPESGEMGSEEVAILRSLARQAVESSIEVGKNIEETDNEGESRTANGGNNDSAIESTKQMGLDMVITIVGEIYGQRDLLELRKVWQTAST